MSAQPGKTQCTPEMMDDRVGFAMDCLSRCMHQSKINQVFRAKYGEPDMPGRTIAEYCSRARKRMREAAERAGADLAAECLAVLRGAVSDPAAGPAVRIKGARAMAKLLGLNAPDLVEVATAEIPFNDLAEHSDEQLRHRLEVLNTARESGGSNGSGRNGGGNGAS